MRQTARRLISIALLALIALILVWWTVFTVDETR